MLILYPTLYQNSWLVPTFFWLPLWDLYPLNHIIGKYWQFYFFTISMPFFSCLIVLARNFSTIYWIRVIRMAILFLFWILEENLSVFLHWVYYLWVCCIWPLLFVVYGLLCSFYIQPFKGFHHERMLYFFKCFFLHLLKWSCDFYPSIY